MVVGVGVGSPRWAGGGQGGLRFSQPAVFEVLFATRMLFRGGVGDRGQVQLAVQRACPDCSWLDVLADAFQHEGLGLDHAAVVVAGVCRPHQLRSGGAFRSRPSSVVATGREKVSKSQVSDSNSFELLHLVAESGEHPTDFTVPPLVENHFQNGTLFVLRADGDSFGMDCCF